MIELNKFVELRQQAGAPAERDSYLTIAGLMLAEDGPDELTVNTSGSIFACWGSNIITAQREELHAMTEGHEMETAHLIPSFESGGLTYTGSQLQTACGGLLAKGDTEIDILPEKSSNALRFNINHRDQSPSHTQIVQMV